ALCKLFNVTLNNHHRALEDATATGEIFLHMYQDMRRLGIEYHDEINSLIKEEDAIRLPVVPGHINIIARSQQGLTNLYHLTSLANTEYFTRDPIVTKKAIETYRDGLLIGSGCRNGYFFDIALRESDEKMEEIIDFYDYIEVQPPSRFEYQKDMLDNWYYCITDTIKRIIKVAKKHGVPVVATGDCHQINKEDTIYRDILVNYTTKSSGYRHYLKGKEIIPDEYFMTTREMLDEFSFLGEQLAYEIVVTNSNLIADSIDVVKSFSGKALPPKDDFMKDKGIPSAEQYVKDRVFEKAHELYGDFLPGMVVDRIDHEMKPIMDNKFSTIYLISQQMVNKSNEDGYVVGSRGSVGSSFVAYLMGITEVNSLPPHYYCPHCGFTSFKYTKEEEGKYGIREDEKEFRPLVQDVLSGFDLPDKNCPVCGELLKRDGHDIPFETFLGLPNKPKTPDIDLNFSGENQGKIHDFIRDVFGETKAFRAGTILTCQSKIAFAIVRDYFNQKNEERISQGEAPRKIRKAEIEALAVGITECKKSSSQHPGGIVVVPRDHEIYEITPVQYPGDSTDRSWMTTHFDYHTFEKNFYKLDVLGQDDPTVIRYLMKFVKEHPEQFPFSDAKDIPVNDSKVYQMMNDTKVLGVQPQDINTPVATYGISEFGTPFVRGLLEDARPKTFAELVKVSGLSHGTDVWNNNAQDLLKGANGQPKIDFKNVIGCRDDIMTDLIKWNVPSELAFSTMEFVRKGNTVKMPEAWAGMVSDLEPYPIPKWYLDSCSKIGYLFPKAHATAYIIMALRIAWFKLYRPIYFYSAVLSKKMTSYSIEVMTGGVARIKEELQRLKSIPQNEIKAKDSDLITTLELALEMCVRGMKFYNVGLYKSEAEDFAVAEDLSGLYMPFNAIDGLGAASAQSIVDARKNGPFDTQKDFLARCQVSSTNFEKMKELGCFKGIEADEQLTLDLGI
nr:PolC-type DNA polymerase III [Gammaproteobacteria bacterium]